MLLKLKKKKKYIELSHFKFGLANLCKPLIKHFPIAPTPFSRWKSFIFCFFFFLNIQLLIFYSLAETLFSKFPLKNRPQKTPTSSHNYKQQPSCIFAQILFQILSTFILKAISSSGCYLTLLIQNIIVTNFPISKK